jgi:hypothetical protein
MRYLRLCLDLLHLQLSCRKQSSWKEHSVCSSKTAITSRQVLFHLITAHLLSDHFLQGLQMMHDTATFGGFSHSFLTSFRDEFLKASVLNFSFLSGADPNHTDIDNVSCCSCCRTRVNIWSSLLTRKELSTMHYACRASISSRTSPSPYYILPDGRHWTVLYHRDLLTMFVRRGTLHSVS